MGECRLWDGRQYQSHELQTMPPPGNHQMINGYHTSRIPKSRHKPGSSEAGLPFQATGFLITRGQTRAAICLNSP